MRGGRVLHTSVHAIYEIAHGVGQMGYSRRDGFFTPRNPLKIYYLVIGVVHYSPYTRVSTESGTRRLRL